MKKILFFLIILLIPISAKANYGIENYRIDMTVLDNGDVFVEEAFKMNGVYNGMMRSIMYSDMFENYYGSIISSTGDYSIYNGNGVELKEIRGINFSKDELFSNFILNGDLFLESKTALKGDYGVYLVNPLLNKTEYTIYNHSKMNKDFYISYTLKNMVVVHTDIAELCLNYFSELSESINNLELYIHIPNNKDITYVWAHNYIEGHTEIIDSETIKINLNYIEKNTPFDFRIVFDKDIINSTKYSNMEALESILEIEMKLDLEKNEERDKEYNLLKSEAYDLVLKADKSKTREDYNLALEKTKQLKNEEVKYELEDKLEDIINKIELRENILKIIYYVSSIIWTIGIVVLVIIMYFKYDKEYKSKFKDKYYNKIPNDYSPAVVGFLIRKRITNDDLTASILNLINKKVIGCEIEDKELKFKIKNVKNINLVDEKLIEFIFNGNKQISFKELKEYAIKNYDSFMHNYSNWINKSIMMAEEENFYIDVLKIKVLGLVYSLIGVISGLALLGYCYLNSTAMIILGLITLLYCTIFTKRSEKGTEDRAKWLAFKRYIEHYKNIKDLKVNELKDIIVYSISLDSFKKIEFSIKKIDNKSLNEMVIYGKLIRKSINNIAASVHNS